jgi:hypothetical protein
VQFHPELTTKMVYRWTTLGHERLTLPNAKPRREHFDGRALHDIKTQAWLDRFPRSVDRAHAAEVRAGSESGQGLSQNAKAVAK